MVGKNKEFLFFMLFLNFLFLRGLYYVISMIVLKVSYNC